MVKTQSARSSGRSRAVDASAGISQSSGTDVPVSIEPESLDGTTVDVETLADLARYGSPPAEAAAVLGLTPAEFRRILRSPAAGALWRRSRAEGRAMIRRAQFQLAEKNAQMAILLGRRHLGQKDPADGASEKSASPAVAAPPSLTIVVETGIDRSAGGTDADRDARTGACVPPKSKSDPA